MGRIAQLALNAALARLADETLGFNATLEAIAPAYGLAPFAVDWGETSPNCFLGEVVLDDLLDSTSVKLDPALAVLYTKNERNKAPENAQKYLLFSGVVEVDLDLYYSWETAHVPHDTEAVSNLLAETVITVFNRYSNQNWGTQLTYNGDIEVSPTPLTRGAEHWVKLVMTRLVFGVHVDS